MRNNGRNEIGRFPWLIVHDSNKTEIIELFRRIHPNENFGKATGITASSQVNSMISQRFSLKALPKDNLDKVDHSD